ncbi:MAG: hypothetical protein DI626_09995 [Micavibrio aeruginosavorus]|uniref:Ankyrin repeat domain-containing protein n=1 Tax=Micavibrio aeruginosavorus TaxID=349221 RepID=A0A2W4ZR64_9BACT|nr:MAG: hypothetical protein DI626_09995 [Micavibrio aeruginosavorus]
MFAMFSFLGLYQRMRMDFTEAGEPVDHDWEMEKAFHGQRLRDFNAIVKSGRCTAHALDRMMLRTATLGEEDFVKALRKAGASEQAELDGRLSNACYAGKLSSVEALVARGADIHNNREQPLRTSVIGGQRIVAEYLIEQGCDIAEAFHKEAREQLFKLPRPDPYGNAVNLYLKLFTRHCPEQVAEVPERKSAEIIALPLKARNHTPG